MRPIVCKFRLLLECDSTHYELRANNLRVVRQQGCNLRANQLASCQVKRLMSRE